jgi:siderophore synthetase component
MMVYTANPPEPLTSVYLPEDRVMFGIHPQVIASMPDDPYVKNSLAMCTGRKTISVVPSSSTRTLYVTDVQPPHAVKVHFPFKISRYGRKMRHEVLEQAINVSRELENGIGQLDGRFAFLREVIGVVHRNLEPDAPRGENWGYLVRDMTPFPHPPDQSRLIPGFALYGNDHFTPETPLLLYDLIGDADPLTFILENIMLPIVRHWVACFRHFGYLLEPHGQNVILEVGSDHTVVRIVHRDLSVAIDMRRRRDIGLSDQGLNHYNRMEHDAFHSITYDRFMGGHFFDRIVHACQEKHSNLSRQDFCRPCRETFARLLPEHRQYFPKTVWYFSEKRDQFNKPLYKDTGVKPEWRP